MDGYPVDVTKNQIEAYRGYIRGRLRALIQEHNYTFSAGQLAGLMSDLRALDHITPLDATDAGAVKGPAADNDAAAKAQRAERAHNAKEAKKAERAA
jgi:hypothetical protein